MIVGCVLAVSLSCPLFKCFASQGDIAARDNSTGVLEQLKSELGKEGVSDEFLKVTEGSVKRMISSGAPIADIKTVLTDLWNEKVKGRALKNAVSAVAELVESGDDVLEAAKISSGAAHQAEAEGLSGFGVGMRVKKAVEDRKVYLKSLGKGKQ